MNREIRWTNRGLRGLEVLDPPVATRIGAAIEHHAATDRGDARLLRGREGEWRLRVGPWRVIFRFVDGGRAIEVLHVGHRREVYRRG